MSAYGRVCTRLVPATIQIVKKLAWHTPLSMESQTRSICTGFHTNPLCITGSCTFESVRTNQLPIVNKLYDSIITLPINSTHSFLPNLRHRTSLRVRHLHRIHRMPLRPPIAGLVLCYELRYQGFL